MQTAVECIEMLLQPGLASDRQVRTSLLRRGRYAVGLAPIHQPYRVQEMHQNGKTIGGSEQTRYVPMLGGRKTSRHKDEL
jgi:hypothetical protein